MAFDQGILTLDQSIQYPQSQLAKSNLNHAVADRSLPDVLLTTRAHTHTRERQRRLEGTLIPTAQSAEAGHDAFSTYHLQFYKHSATVLK